MHGTPSHPSHRTLLATTIAVAISSQNAAKSQISPRSNFTPFPFPCSTGRLASMSIFLSVVAIVVGSAAMLAAGIFLLGFFSVFMEEDEEEN